MKQKTIRQIPTEELAEMWRDDEQGEYVAVNDSGEAFHIAHGSRMEQIQPKYGNLFAGIRAWMAQNQYWPNVWQVNERGNVELLNSSTGIVTQKSLWQKVTRAINGAEWMSSHPCQPPWPNVPPGTIEA